MVGSDRSTSRRHSGSRTRTTSLLSSGDIATAVARSMAGPTATLHENRSLPSEKGASARSRARASGNTDWTGSISADLVPYTRDGHADFTGPRAVDRTQPVDGRPAHLLGRCSRERPDYNMSLILASASPRRAELLARAGFAFEVSPFELDERPWSPETPAAHVTRLAEAKASAGAARHPGRLVLGADTIVVVEGRILGKPSSDAEAAEMLGLLSDGWHEVMTAVALRRDGCHVAETAVTRVHFVSLSSAEIAWYVASTEPRDVVYRLLRQMETASPGRPEL
jgi:septum formation protein